MSRTASLRNAIMGWFAALSIALYLMAAGLVLGLDGAHVRAELADSLYDSAENLATYVSASGRLDYPELSSVEGREVPVWLRVIAADGRTLAATPGFPPLTVRPGPTTPMGRTEHHRLDDGKVFELVRHEVWRAPGWRVEAVSSLAPLRQRAARLRLVLALTGLLLLPLAAGAGYLLARRACGPVAALTGAVHGLDGAHLAERLSAPGAVRELEALVDAFNGLLQRLQTAVETMRRFTADASHELRTPVAVLRTGIEVALRRERTAAEYRELLDQQLEEIVRLQRTVEGLLALARDGGGGAVVRGSGAVDLASVAVAAADALAPLASNRGVVVERRLEPGVAVEGDPDLLRLLAANLLDNAIKHTPTGRRVTLAVEGAGHEARLVVADEGTGVAPAQRERIFERFYRGGGDGAGRGIGGIGLSVVRWVAEVHGGAARLLPSVDGAVFEVRLPRLAGGGLREDVAESATSALAGHL